MQVNHGSLNFRVSEQNLDGVQIRALIQQVCGKGMAQAVCGIHSFFKSGNSHGIADDDLHGSIAHRFTGSTAFKQVVFGPKLQVIASQLRKQAFGEYGDAVLVALAFDDFDL